MSNNFDLRTMTKDELVAHVVAYKKCGRILAVESDEVVRGWASKKDRQSLIELCAGWGKDDLIAAGLRNS